MLASLSLKLLMVTLVMAALATPFAWGFGAL